MCLGYSRISNSLGNPFSTAFQHDLGECSRVIIFDKRGTGMSDRIDGASSVEERVDDMPAVMEAAGSAHATIFALSEGDLYAFCLRRRIPKRLSGQCCSAPLPILPMRKRPQLLEARRWTTVV